MATNARRLTFDDLETIPEEQEGDRHEIIDGALIVTPLPDLAHQIISGNVVFAIDRVVRERGFGFVFHAPTAIRFAPDNVLVPDGVFVRRNDLDAIGHEAIDITPDLVVEILSPGTRQRDRNDKREFYARFGVPEYWIVDPDQRSVTVLTLVDGAYEAVPAGEGGVIRSLVLFDLVLLPEAVFKGA